MAVVSEALSLNLNFSFLAGGWVNPDSDSILPEKFLRYNRELKPGPFGRQSVVLTRGGVQRLQIPAGILTLTAGLEGRDSADYATISDSFTYHDIYL